MFIFNCKMYILVGERTDPSSFFEGFISLSKNQTRVSNAQPADIKTARTAPRSANCAEMGHSWMLLGPTGEMRQLARNATRECIGQAVLCQQPCASNAKPADTRIKRGRPHAPNVWRVQCTATRRSKSKNASRAPKAVDTVDRRLNAMLANQEVLSP